MARHTLACLITLVAVASAAKDQSRWSRQISSYTSDMSDWVPLSGPVEREPLPVPQIKRQAVAEPRILSEPAFPGFARPTGFSQDFPPRTYYNPPANRQLYLQSVPAVPSAPQNYLNDPGFGQNIRFGLSQPNFPLNQAFVSSQFPFDVPQLKQRPQQVSHPVKFENFPKPSLPLSPQAKPFNSQIPKKQESLKFVDGYRVENISSDYSAHSKKPVSLQKLKYESFEKVPKTEMIPPKPKLEREEVQLLYVPVESLNRGQFNFRSPLTSQLNSDSYTQGLPRPNPLKPTFINEFQRPIPKPLDSFGNDQDFFNNFKTQYRDLDQIPKFSTASTPFPTTLQTTPRPKKLKPHQPPLAIFLTQEAKKGNQVKVGDVLTSLKNAETIAVLDAVNPLNAPKVFIGPNSLNPPENFVKFELPYLSNIEHSDKKLRQLPFFVAPLSYNTPQGFAKIPFPSPHVGSVVINSQIRDTTTTATPSTPFADVLPNSYSTSPQSYKQETRPATQRPTISYYTTAAPKTNAPPNYQSNYYSIEPQTVSTIKPPLQPQASLVANPQKTSYFLSNFDDHYDPANIDYQSQNKFQTKEPVRAFNIVKQTTTPTTPRTTVSTTTATASTYPSQLLETHNPYSINQAFHFSTPLDYHNLFDESYATPGAGLQPPPASVTASPLPKPVEVVTEKQKYTSSPTYSQNYSPEIHYESENQNSRYPAFNINEYTTKSVPPSEFTQSSIPVTHDNIHSVSDVNPPTEYNVNVDTQSSVINDNTDPGNKLTYETETASTKSPYLYNKYETSFETEEKQTNSTTSTTTTTTKRPLRTRGRPRYTTPRSDSNESTTRTVVTRRPLRERRPLPTRPRYEPNKITTERATRKPIDSNESTTKYSRSRTRGRVHYKPSDSDEYHNKPNKHSSKEDDLAYQRDVLHQNYPVTLMERASTVDIEAITEPSGKSSSTKNLDDTEFFDTDNAYSNDRTLISQQAPNIGSKEETQHLKSEEQTDAPYVSKTTFHSRSSLAPIEALSSFGETAPETYEDLYVKQTTPVQNIETISFVTEASSTLTEQNEQNQSANNEFSGKNEEITTPETDIEKIVSQEASRDDEPEENVIQTTPSYNRVRVRPGVIRQYHQASTESSRTKTERRRPVQAVTYRPTFDRRRTTMRIEEIEADLKTKQVHARPEVQEHRHPVYRPEPTTEPSVSQETTTKRGVFRRRRPSYTTTTTEASSTKKSTYEIKNRFRGRRPTEKTTDKSEAQTDVSTSTVRNTLYSRYSNRPRLSERYNKKPEPEESEDQDANYSINRPKFVEPEVEQWSSKISTDSFKPYNPNEIIEDQKEATTLRSNDDNESELDIITARNEYEDILLTVTPATNNRENKKVPDIPPTLEALVEQSKITKAEAGDTMSTFESMLEEVMKSLEEQDEDEYATNVMKHKGGEIGEIPPERIISSGDSYSKTTTIEQQEATTTEPEAEESNNNQDEDRKTRRRGFWKKVKVRPITESIETAESQYYPNSANRVGNIITLTKTVHDKSGKYDKPKPTVTTYKPNLEFKNIFENDEDDVGPIVDIPKVNKEVIKHTTPKEPTTTESNKETTESSPNPGDMDLGTGSPDPTIADNIYHSTPTEPSPSQNYLTLVDRSDGFSFMDYLFGVTSESNDKHTEPEKVTEKLEELEITTEKEKPKLITTESTYIPEEITEIPLENVDDMLAEFDIKKLNTTEVKVEHKNTPTTEKTVELETSSVSSFMDPTNVVSTSMSTEVSHETEICFRGKCIKSNKDIL